MSLATTVVASEEPIKATLSDKSDGADKSDKSDRADESGQ